MLVHAEEFNNDSSFNWGLNVNGKLRNPYFLSNRHPCFMVYGLSKELYCHYEYLIVIFFHSCHLKINQNKYKLKFRFPVHSILPS